MAVSAHTDRLGQLASGLRILVTEQGTTTTIALAGEWDLAQHDAARHAIQTALARRPERVLLDLARLTFMDSTGIHGVIELARAATRLSISLVVIPGPRAVQRLFDLCGLSNAFTFVPAAG
jgi:anti-anti-sigma factor